MFAHFRIPLLVVLIGMIGMIGCGEDEKDPINQPDTTSPAAGPATEKLDTPDPQFL